MYIIHPRQKFATLPLASFLTRNYPPPKAQEWNLIHVTTAKSTDYPSLNQHPPTHPKEKTPTYEKKNPTHFHLPLKKKLALNLFYATNLLPFNDSTLHFFQTKKLVCASIGRFIISNAEIMATYKQKYTSATEW